MVRVLWDMPKQKETVTIKSYWMNNARENVAWHSVSSIRVDVMVSQSQL